MRLKPNLSAGPSTSFKIVLSLLVQPLFIANLLLYQNEVHQDILSLLEQQCISAVFNSV